MIRHIRKSLRKSRGFTLVELMIVVAIVGILAALAIYGVRKYVANAKTAEARNSLGQMGKDAITAYAKDSMADDVVVLKDKTAVANALCTSGVSVPGGVTGDLLAATIDAKVQGKKYQSSPVEWATGTRLAGWTCLKYSMNDPQHYQYQYYQAGGVSDETGTFQTQAIGDLDGDGTISKFFIKGAIQKDGTKLAATLAPTIGEDKPDE